MLWLVWSSEDCESESSLGPGGDSSSPSTSSRAGFAFGCEPKELRNDLFVGWRGLGGRWIRDWVTVRVEGVLEIGGAVVVSKALFLGDEEDRPCIREVGEARVALAKTGLSLVWDNMVEGVLDPILP